MCLTRLQLLGGEFKWNRFGSSVTDNHQNILWHFRTFYMYLHTCMACASFIYVYIRRENPILCVGLCCFFCFNVSSSYRIQRQRTNWSYITEFWMNFRSDQKHQKHKAHSQSQRNREMNSSCVERILFIVYDIYDIRNIIWFDSIFKFAWFNTPHQKQFTRLCRLNRFELTKIPISNHHIKLNELIFNREMLFICT